jgi:alkaline phosphatase D
MKDRRLFILIALFLGVVLLLTPIAFAGRGVGDTAVAPQQTDTDEPGQVLTPTVMTAVGLEPAADDQPAITHGPLSGEVSAETAVLWARGNQAGELAFTVAADVDFAEIVAETAVTLDEGSDFTGEALIEGLEPGTPYLYQAILTTTDGSSEAVQGYFQTAPAEAAAFDFVFGACLGGQNYCRNPETGWEIFNTMLAQSPDFFLFTGDTIYVDNGCSVPENVPGAEEPARDLAGYRSRYQYHLADPHYAEFLAQTPVYATWDDHEVLDDFGGPALSRTNPQMVADGAQAFFEYWPIQAQEDGNPQIYRTIPYGEHAEFIILDTRSYRDPNVNWDPHPRNLTPKTMLGAEQFAWLQESLANSTATWKFIVTSVPLSYPTGFPQPEVDGRDSWANYTEPSGYETELLALIFFIESQNIENVVFLTGDTHWPFALSYDPDRDGEANFHEFGASPLSALTLPPVQTPDPTLNPTVLYAEGEFAGTLFNFGQIAVDEAGSLTFRLLDSSGGSRYEVTLEPVLGDTAVEE